MKTLTVRLSDQLGDRLARVAHLDGRSMNEIIAALVEPYVAERFADPEFQAKLREQADRILHELRQEGGTP